MPHRATEEGSVRTCLGGRSRSEGKAWVGAFAGLSVGEAMQGRFGLAALIRSGRLWAAGVASSYLVPGPEMI